MIKSIKNKIFKRLKEKSEALQIQSLLNPDVVDLANMTLFSYHDILPLYKILGCDRDATGQHLMACLAMGFTPSYFVAHKIDFRI